MAGNLFSWRRFSSSTYLEPAYLLHPRVRTTDPDKQVLALSKSQLISEPPPEFRKFSQNLDTTPWREKLRKDIIYARNYETASKFTPRGYPYNLFQNIIKTLLTNAPPEFSHLGNLNYVGNCNINSTWRIMGQLFGVRGQLNGILIKSKKPSPIFYSRSLVNESMNWSISSCEKKELFAKLNTWNVTVNEHKEMETTPFYFPYIHTVVLIDSQATLESHLIQRATLILHGLLLEQAQQKHKDIIGGLEMLPEPECGQCIVTNGKRFSFIWYQLNTANFTELSSGVKNLLAIEKPGLLYKGISKIRAGNWHSYRGLDEYNDDILKTLLSMFLWQQ